MEIRWLAAPPARSGGNAETRATEDAGRVSRTVVSAREVSIDVTRRWVFASGGAGGRGRGVVGWGGGDGVLVDCDVEVDGRAGLDGEGEGRDGGRVQDGAGDGNQGGKWVGDE